MASINFQMNLIERNGKFYAQKDEVDNACATIKSAGENLPYITINGKKVTVTLCQSWEDMAGMYEVKDFIPTDFSLFFTE